MGATWICQSEKSLQKLIRYNWISLFWTPLGSSPPNPTFHGNWRPPTLASRSPSTTRDHDTSIHMRDGWCKHNNLGRLGGTRRWTVWTHTSFLMENYCLDPKQMTRLHKTKPSFLPTMMICGFPARKKVGSKDHLPYKGLKSDKNIQVGMMKVIQNGCQRRNPGWVGRFLYAHTKFLSCLAWGYVYYTTTFYRKSKMNSPKMCASLQNRPCWFPIWSVHPWKIQISNPKKWSFGRWHSFADGVNFLSGWFQPIWNICSSNWMISPGIGVNIKNIWNHQPSSGFQPFIFRVVCSALFIASHRVSMGGASSEPDKSCFQCVQAT